MSLVCSKFTLALSLTSSVGTKLVFLVDLVLLVHAFRLSSTGLERDSESLSESNDAITSAGSRVGSLLETTVLGNNLLRLGSLGVCPDRYLSKSYHDITFILTVYYKETF